MEMFKVIRYLTLSYRLVTVTYAAVATVVKDKCNRNKNPEMLNIETNMLIYADYI